MKYNDWKTDLNDSTKALLSIKDTILPKLISGAIHSVENKNDEILILMDVKSGIDFIRENDTGLQGIAARVQWGHNWETFTIRKERKTGTKTEFEKRLDQINNGYIYPTFTLHGYFDNRQNNNCLSVAIIKTKDLYNYVLSNKDKIKESKSDNKFLFVNWTDVEHLIKKFAK